MRTALVVLLSLLPALGQEEAIRGSYLEDRSNHVHGCYCEWSGQSQTGGHQATFAWRIDSGEWAGTDLSGATLALVVLADSSLSFGWPARRSVLILDAALPSAARRAAEDLIRARFASLAGDILAVRPQPLSFDISPDSAAVRSPGLLEVRMRKARLPEDNLPGATRWFDPFLPLTEPQLGTTLMNRYSGLEFRFTWLREEPTTSGYYGAFVLYPRPAT